MGCPHIQSQCWPRGSSLKSQMQTSNNKQQKKEKKVKHMCTSRSLNPKKTKQKRKGSVCKWKRQVTVNSRGHWIDMRSWNIYQGGMESFVHYIAKAHDKSTSWLHFALTCNHTSIWDEKINKRRKFTMQAKSIYFCWSLQIYLFQDDQGQRENLTSNHHSQRQSEKGASWNKQRNSRTLTSKPSSHQGTRCWLVRALWFQTL